VSETLSRGARAHNDRVRLALYSPACLPGYHLPYFAAADNGIFDRHGIDVELFDPEGGLQTVEGVGAGRYDACITSVTHYLRAKSADPYLTARFAFMIAARPHHAAYAVAGRADGGGKRIVRFADLEGATFLGTADSGFGREYSTLLDHLGLRVGRFEQPRAGELKALCRGEGDVTLEFLDVAPRFAAAAEREGLRLVVLPFFEAGLDVYGSGLVTSEALLEDRRDVALRLVRSMRDSLETTRETPLAGLDALRRRLPGVSAQRAEAGWEASGRLIFLPDAGLGTMTHEKWERTVVHYAEVYGADSLPAEDVFTTALLEHAGITE